MSAYLVLNYTITNPQGYEAYIPAVLPTFASANAEVVVADYESDTVEGSPGPVTIVVRFESKEAARAWYESPEYEAAKPHRTDNSEGMAVLCNGFGDS